MSLLRQKSVMHHLSETPSTGTQLGRYANALSSTHARHPTPQDIVAFLPYACKELGTSFVIEISTKTQEERVSKGAQTVMKGKKIRSPSVTADMGSSEETVGKEASPNSQSVTIVATMNTQGGLVELNCDDCKLRCQMMRLIELCVPCHPTLTRLTARRSAIDGKTLHHLAKVLALSNITELCLDDSKLPINIDELLSNVTARMTYLSLVRCRIDRATTVKLAKCLVPAAPVFCNLAVLRLGSNAIGDKGAFAFANALRTNRTLRHLDLSNNHITDKGFVALLSSLCEFELTVEEQQTRRRNRMRHTLEKLSAPSLTPAADERALVSPGRRRPPAPSRRSSNANQVTVKSIVSLPIDKFMYEPIMRRGNHTYCQGNGVLSSLNVAYNWLGAESLVRLAAVLQEQTLRGVGLVRVELSGNPLPEDTKLLTELRNLLDVACAGAVIRTPRPSRTTAVRKSVKT